MGLGRVLCNSVESNESNYTAASKSQELAGGFAFHKNLLPAALWKYSPKSGEMPLIGIYLMYESINGGGLSVERRIQKGTGYASRNRTTEKTPK